VRKQGERYLSLEEIKKIPWDHYPIFMYSDGGSLFGWLIRKADDSAGSHLWTLVGNDAIANQSFTFRLVPVAKMEPGIYRRTAKNDARIHLSAA
jgi:hypothetical protein